MRLLAVAIALLAACGTDTKPAGATCTGSGECTPGLVCGELGQFAGSACTVVGKVCTEPCRNTTDCANLGSGFMCFATCSSDMICGATAP